MNEEKPKELSGLKLFVILLCAGLFATILAMLVVSLAIPSNLMVTNQECNYRVATASNLSFTNGSMFAINIISEEITACNKLLVNYSNYTYTLVSEECLQINLTGGK